MYINGHKLNIHPIVRIFSKVQETSFITPPLSIRRSKLFNNEFCEGIRDTGLIQMFILHWFYLSSQTALTEMFLLYTVTEQDFVFRVPDSCWAIVRNDNSTILLYLLVLDNLAVGFGAFVTLQDNYNIRTLFESIKFIWSGCQSLDFLPVSKARTNEFYICRQRTFVVYVCFLLVCTDILFDSRNSDVIQ